MRVTVDVDSKTKAEYHRFVKRALRIMPTPPQEIYLTSRGFHAIWSGLPISFEESLKLRKKLGDDKNRVRLDETREKNVKQVLFTRKVSKWK